jgi:hypothetical protein
MTEDIQKGYTHGIVESRANPAGMTSFLWVLLGLGKFLFSPTNSILVMQACKEASIQFLILIFIFLFSFSLYSLSAGLPLRCIPQHSQNIFLVIK